MILNMLVITVIILIITTLFLPWWGFLLIVAGLFLWWVYSFSPRYSIGGYSFLAPSEDKILALTFTGGSEEQMKTALQWLEENQIPAVFFVYGKIAQENPQVIKDIYGYGHMLGIAGFEPKEMWFTKYFDSDDIHKVIHHTQESLAEVIPHFHAALFRPYLGRKSLFNAWRLRHNFGYYVVLWSFKLGTNALQKIKPRMIIQVDLDQLKTEQLLSHLHTLKNYVQPQGYHFVQIEI